MVRFGVVGGSLNRTSCFHILNAGIHYFRLYQLLSARVSVQIATQPDGTLREGGYFLTTGFGDNLRGA
jgi:hypothetical protein